MLSFNKMFLLLCIILFVGCAAQTQRVWQKPNASQQDYNIDLGQCRAQGFSAPGMPLVQVVLIIESCMAGKGWYVVEIPK